MNISLIGYGENAVTFEAAAGVAEGAPVKLTANGTVGPCAAGDVFCGVALNVRDGYAAVQLGGYVQVPYDGTAPNVGYQTFAAAEGGKIQTSASGRSLLVTDVDETAKLCGLIL